MMKKTHLLLLSLILMGGQAAAQPAADDADLILTNGKIYTVNAAQPWVDAVAIKGRKLIYVGTAAGAGHYRGAKTQVIDLHGKMAMPGLNDLHVHPLEAYRNRLFECQFPQTYTADQMAQKISDCVASNPDATWIVGGQWETNFFENNKIASPREWLDKISGDKAVLLRDSSFHNHWANSKALAIAGIDRDTPDVSGGEIVRDKATRVPNGLLFERAADLVVAKIPSWTPAQNQRAAFEGVNLAASLGITGIKEAWASVPMVEAYKAVQVKDGLNLHLSVCLGVDPFLNKDETLDMARLDRVRRENAGPNLYTDCAKIVLDGVPSAARSAAMLQDYASASPDAPTTKGKLIFTPEKLDQMVVALDRAGITVKIHAAGDGSQRAALDAIAYAQKVNGNSGLRHELAHAGFVDPIDIPRFVKLNAVAEVSPYIWFPSIKTESIVRTVGERGEHYFPVKTMLKEGVNVVAGSDWPAGALPDMNPWIGMEGLITRRNPWGDYPGVLWPEQAITLQQAIEIYTKNGARALKLGDVSGSIETGKWADMIVLDQNLFDIPADMIGDTKVDLTLFEGRIVYRRAASGGEGN
jgi:predicted amidohydrolase YtcJ